MSRERELREMIAQLGPMSMKLRELASSMDIFDEVLLGGSKDLQRLQGMLHGHMIPVAQRLDADAPLRHNHWASGVYSGCPACFTRTLTLDTPPTGG